MAVLAYYWNNCVCHRRYRDLDRCVQDQPIVGAWLPFHRSSILGFLDPALGRGKKSLLPATCGIGHSNRW